MDDLPDVLTVRIRATDEALTRLGLLNPSADLTILALLEKLVGEDPQDVCADYRKMGDQLPIEEKRRLGIREGANFSRQAVKELSEKGLSDPLRAHELTLLRASFVMSRYQSAMSYQRFMAHHRRVGMVVQYAAAHPDVCDTCKKLDDTPVGSDWGLFAPDTCDCLTAPHALRLRTDRIIQVVGTEPGEDKPGKPTLLGRARAFFART